MASSQVEVGSSYPFGCVLTSHNGRRDSCSSTTTHAKNITRDRHPNSNVPMISSDSAAPNNKTQKKPSWVSRVAKNNHQGSLSFTRRKVENFHGDDKDGSSSSSLLTTVVLDHVEVIEEEFPSSRSTSSFTSPRREVSLSPPHSDDSSDHSGERISSNLGASSLVQIWEKRLNQSNSNATSKSNTPRTSPDHDHCSRVVSEEGEYSCDELQPFTDWESDQLICSSKAPPHSSDDAAAAAERERGRVADLIKRLTVTKQIQSDNENNDHEFVTTASTYAYNPSTPKQVEHRSSSFGRVKSFPRIRGRQAFNDLIMQFACDRRGELHNLAERGAVSKFTQRGRIQSLLRLRLLQRGVAAFDPPNYNYQKSEGNYNKQEGSAIMQLKKRFNTGDGQRTSALAVGSNPRRLDREKISNTTTRLDNFPPASSNQLSKDTTVINCEKHTQNSVPPQTSTADNKEAANYTSSNITLQAQNDDEPKQTAGASLSMANSNANDDTSETRDRQHDTVETCYDEIVEEEEASDRHCDEARPNYDWISNISRPRSYWEKLRQEWYSEMLGFGSQNDERRKLLERRTVSSVLSSDFPERMDKLMKSHRGIETHLTSNQYDEEGREQLMAFFQDRLRVRGSIPEEDGRDSREEEEEVGRRNAEEEKEEENSMISGGLDHDHSGYQSSSPPANTPSSSTWSYRDNDGVDDSDRVASESSLLPSQSQSFYQDTPQYSSPSTNHHSIEMDFIYDMRGQMEQLFREMSELRKSISSCMNMQMQMQMQQFKNQEVVHTVKVKEKKFHNKTPKKGHCCICYEKKANAVLYRCGHMCACLKCAKELQWNSGKCPICEAPIIDVVQLQN